jgi:hypothetical protein
VKQTRRLLRVSQSRGLNRQAYVDAMLKLDEDQQDLEQLVREMTLLERRLPNLEPTRATELGQARDAVKAMEHYLGLLWREHEDVAAISDDEFTPADLPRFNGFVERVQTGRSDFHLFNSKYHRSRATLLELLADSRIGSQFV